MKYLLTTACFFAALGIVTIPTAVPAHDAPNSAICSNGRPARDIANCPKPAPKAVNPTPKKPTKAPRR